MASPQITSTHVVLRISHHEQATRASARGTRMVGGNVERLSIKTPGDFIALMGHSLGYWPQESLVCIIVDDRRIGATLRVNLPKPGHDAARYVDDVVKCIAVDREATGVVFGIFTHAPWQHGDPRPYEATLESLTGRLSEREISLRDGWYIGESTFTNYLRMTDDSPRSYPLDRITASQLNAELVFRGSSIASNPGFNVPVLARRDVGEEVFKHCGRIEAMSPPAAIAEARALWCELLNGSDMPTDDEAAELLADFKFTSVRDRLLADIPGISGDLRDLLLGQTKQAPRWGRVDRATDVLLYVYTLADGAHAAPVLTSLGVIQWWEGRSSRAHECFQRALEADPYYRLARLSDQMIGEGILAPWATDRNAAYQPPMNRGPHIEGLGMA
ncbi:DUF4192 domain-containing protein [Arthrobacter livingstonensis]|uniref:DUF4192 domain-containing protein n=1 Tax=Arthrobacter livingstonensis TaxID=670078 RepID=A0A2V5LGT5_9MICC|nr:DUF4192 domain-containing protein [Arthrobacter livingstonensis]